MQTDFLLENVATACSLFVEWLVAECLKSANIIVSIFGGPVGGEDILIEKNSDEDLPRGRKRMETNVVSI